MSTVSRLGEQRGVSMQSGDAAIWPSKPVAAVERSEAAHEDVVLAKPADAFHLAAYGSVYISVAAVTATYGFALTATHF